MDNLKTRMTWQALRELAEITVGNRPQQVQGGQAMDFQGRQTALITKVLGWSYHHFPSTSSSSTFTNLDDVRSWHVEYWENKQEVMEHAHVKLGPHVLNSEVSAATTSYSTDCYFSFICPAERHNLDTLYM